MNTLTMDQRRSALLKANEVRTGVANFKRDIRTMSKTEAAYYLAAALESPVAPLLGANVWLLLRAVPGLGDERCRSYLAAARVSLRAAKVRDLTARQRRVLAGALRTYGDRWA